MGVFSLRNRTVGEDGGWGIVGFADLFHWSEVIVRGPKKKGRE